MITPVAVVVGTPENIFKDPEGRDTAIGIDHPMTNGDPDAILFVTQRARGAGPEWDAVLMDITVAYWDEEQRWLVMLTYPYPDTPGVSLLNRRFHLLIVKTRPARDNMEDGGSVPDENVNSGLPLNTAVIRVIPAHTVPREADQPEKRENLERMDTREPSAVGAFGVKQMPGARSKGRSERRVDMSGLTHPKRHGKQEGQGHTVSKESRE